MPVVDYFNQSWFCIFSRSHRIKIKSEYNPTKVIISSGKKPKKHLKTSLCSSVLGVTWSNKSKK
jgi:hypothetical protein